MSTTDSIHRNSGSCKYCSYSQLSCRHLFGLSEDKNRNRLLTDSFHTGFVVTPDVAVAKTFRTEIIRMQLFAGSDEMPKPFDQILQRSTMADPRHRPPHTVS